LRESSKIYIENNQQIERKIILQDQEIIPLFDTPHLIKGIRNYRITKDLVWEVNEEILSVKLDHIVKVYLYDSAWGELRSLHKITDMQIRSKRCPMQLKFLRNMYLLWKKMWIKKQHIGRIFGFILKFSRKWQV
jgi:hypothetical protein